MDTKFVLAWLSEAFPMQVVIPIAAFLAVMYFFGGYAYDVYTEKGKEPVQELAKSIRQEVKVVPWSDLALVKAHDDSVTEIVYSVEGEPDRVKLQ